MHKFFKKKTTLAATILALCLAVTLIFSKNDPFTGITRIIFTPFLSLASGVSEFIATTKAYFVEVDVYKTENERLIRENFDLKQKEKSAAQFRVENERLSSLLGLSEEIDNYNSVAARVVSYEPSNSYNTIMINKGTISGITVGDIVISADGVVGKVSDVGLNWANVVSLLDSSNAIGTRVCRTGEIVLTEGDADLSKKGLCRVSFVNSATQISIGDFLETSGAAGIYPPGFMIGSVKEITIDENGAKYGIVEPCVDFNNLYEVIVIKK